MDKFAYVPLRIAQGAFERVPLMPFRQSRLQKAASVLWLYRQTFEEDDEASHTASKNAIPACAAECHFLDLVEVLVEAVNFMRVR